MLNSVEVGTRIEKYLILIFQKIICEKLVEKKLGCWIETARRKVLAFCMELIELSVC